MDRIGHVQSKGDGAVVKVVSFGELEQEAYFAERRTYPGAIASMQQRSLTREKAPHRRSWSPHYVLHRQVPQILCHSGYSCSGYARRTLS